MSDLRITFLGGLGEIGRNCMVLEQDGRIVIDDCGVMFPPADQRGKGLILPNFDYLIENKDRVEGIFVTHAHEDHIGALPYLFAELDAPLFGCELALEMVAERMAEAGVSASKRVAIEAGDSLDIGPFGVTFLATTHSVPHAMSVAIDTSVGMVFHTGDFKIDLNPIDGHRIDLGRIGELGRKGGGIKLLLSDSTNAEVPGRTPSESTVGVAFRELFRKHDDRRVIVASFSSHLHRVFQVTQAALEAGRYVSFLGRSMETNARLAEKLGIFKFPPSRIVPHSQIDNYPPEDMCVVCTGSQGEPMSAISLMAAGENRWIDLHPNDVVVFSAHAIPGNEEAVGRVIDNVFRRGALAIYGNESGVHVSGHGAREELREMLDLTGPEYFIPVHGEYRHLAQHASLAQDAGINPAKIAICEDGDSIVLGEKGLAVQRGFVSGQRIFVDR